MSKDVKAFLKVGREKQRYRPVCERLKDYQQVTLARIEEKAQIQASRCMDCGIPFCHWACPIGNYIPEWNDAVLEGLWRRAFSLLNETNNLPEITGRVCPAPCEYSCVLGINDDPVTICENEFNIIEYAFKYGLIKANPPQQRSGKKIAVVGSGPAGISCAAQLNKVGHSVTVFEKNAKPGGIMRYGIPDFKLEKSVLDRRIKLLEEEGIVFKCSKAVGEDIKSQDLKKEFDAVIIAIGSGRPRDLAIEGRDLEGIYFAMDYLSQSNRRLGKEDISGEKPIVAKGKKVVVIGGGDTGSDCVGTANRQGASCVVQIEVMPKPLDCRGNDYPWPKYPLLLKTSSSHEEGAQRDWAILTKKFVGENGILKKLACIRVEFSYEAIDANNQTGKCPLMKEVAGSEFEIEADMAILAVGFVSPEPSGPVSDLKLDADQRGNIKTGSSYMSSQRGVFAAGDARRGQSLVVWAISEGRQCAYQVDKYLMGSSSLPAI